MDKWLRESAVGTRYVMYGGPQRLPRAKRDGEVVGYCSIVQASGCRMEGRWSASAIPHLFEHAVDAGKSWSHQRRAIVCKQNKKHILSRSRGAFATEFRTRLSFALLLWSLTNLLPYLPHPPPSRPISYQQRQK